MTQPQHSPVTPARGSWSQRRARLGRGVRRGSLFGLGVAAALLAVALYGVAVPGPRPIDQTDINRSIASALASQTTGPAVSQLVYQAVAPSLVVIEASGEVGALSSVDGGAIASLIPTAGPSTSAAPRTSAGPGVSPAPSASAGQSGQSGRLGSGVVIDQAGDIMTCLHVVAGATSIQVTFADGTKSAATITSTQPANDIAVLQATQPPATIVPAVLGNPRSVQVGSEAFVVGNPFGLYGSMSSGIVSGLNRSFQLPNNGVTLHGLIQIDAAVNPGSSGGPLVNRAGQVVGIVSALINPTQEDVFIGIGLAVPIDVAGGAAGLPPD
jgi:S1-C subfamily serine protease